MADENKIRIVGGTVGIQARGATSIITHPDRTIEYPHPPNPSASVCESIVVEATSCDAQFGGF